MQHPSRAHPARGVPALVATLGLLLAACGGNEAAHTAELPAQPAPLVAPAAGVNEVSEAALGSASAASSAASGTPAPPASCTDHPKPAKDRFDDLRSPGPK